MVESRIMGTVLHNLIVGPIALIVGVVIICFRRPLRDWAAESQAGVFGRRVADTAAKLQSPFWVGFVGAVIVLMGIYMIASAIVTLAGSAS